jgi:AcrR family transcriptional regulator
MTETETKILDTAERLFGENGYGATSLRQIIADAGVNLAAIHYHFGTKEELLDQLILRMAAPVNEERLAILDQVESQAGRGPLDIRKVLEAFLGPPLRRAGNKPQVVRLMGRMYAEGLMPVILEKHFATVVSRFYRAMQRALPHLPPEELALRAQFFVGAMAHTMFTCSGIGGQPPGAPGFQKGPDALADPQLLLEELVAFAAAGFLAPAVQAKGRGRKRA